VPRDEKRNAIPPDTHKITLDNVEQVVGPLTAEIVEMVFTAYDSPLVKKGYGTNLISTFKQQMFSGWVGLAIIARDSSYANARNNKEIDDRNVANPFSAHFTHPNQVWHKDQYLDLENGKYICDKNSLLVPDANGSYDCSTHSICMVPGYRLATFKESAVKSASILRAVGYDHYRETAGYKKR
jgi:hypothetical protein